MLLIKVMIEIIVCIIFLQVVQGDMLFVVLLQVGVKQLGGDKIGCLLVQFVDVLVLCKLLWICVWILLGNVVQMLKVKLCENCLVMVCEEVSCLNIYECFSYGMVMFMILGEVCICCCLFCDVVYGWFKLLDVNELVSLVQIVVDMGLKYVVVISVDCDDLCDGGVQYFVDCIGVIWVMLLNMCIEVLILDFCGKGCMEWVLDILVINLLDVFNYNIEMVLDLYCNVCLGVDYQWLLMLLKNFKVQYLLIVIKFGIMLGLGEDLDQVCVMMCDLCVYDVDMIMIGQYLQLIVYYYLVLCYWMLEDYKVLEVYGYELGFSYVVFGLMVCLFYYVDVQVKGVGVV